MSTQDKIQKLTETLLKLSSNVTLSDAIDSDSDKSAGIAASPKAVSTLASVILDAAKNASEGSDGENEIPLLGEVKHEIGSWWFSIDGSIPAGGLPHLGHLVSRFTYGTGWTWIETNKTVVSDEEWLAYAESHNGTCPYYSYGDGSTTFRTPSYDQSFLKVLASINGTGSVEEAGLPNIEGSVEFARGIPNPSTSTGALVGTSLTITKYSTAYEDSNVGGKITLDASLSNPIYGNSNTVTPQNYGIIVGIYLVGAVSSPIGETDAAGLLNGISTLESQLGGVVRSVNGVNADAAGDVSEIDSRGTNWIRYTNGIQICYHSYISSFTSKTITFPKEFQSNPVVTVTTSSASAVVAAQQVTTTTFIIHPATDASTNVTFNYIAIGVWK